MQIFSRFSIFLRFLTKFWLKTIKLKRIKYLIFHIKYPKNDISRPRKDFFYMKSVIFQEEMPRFFKRMAFKNDNCKKNTA